MLIFPSRPLVSSSESTQQRGDGANWQCSHMGIRVSLPALQTDGNLRPRLVSPPRLSAITLKI